MRAIVTVAILFGCATPARAQVDPGTTFGAIQILVQRVNEQRLLGQGVVLEANVDGDRVRMSLLGDARKERLDLTLVPGTAEPGIAAGPYVIAWPAERPVPPEVRTIARLTDRIFTWEPHTRYSLRGLGLVRGTMALIALALIGVMLHGLGSGRKRLGP
jgi:hypothetical protein